jgi:DNA polymerase-4
MSPPPRRILLADADAFFVAVARMADPDGSGKASLLIVGGSATSRGVVCSASYEARKFGVRSGMPISRAVRLCPQAMCVPVPRACGVKSREIGAVLARWAPVVAPASIDEWYLDLGGTEGLYRESLAETAHRIRADVIAHTGLSVSFGGGTNRLIAKLAVEVAKPKPGTGADGVHVVAPGDEARFLQRFDLADIPGIGPKSVARFERMGMRTVPDLLAFDRDLLARTLGDGEVRWLLDRAQGKDDSPVQVREEAKQMSREDTFPVDLHEQADIERELQRLAGRVAADLRGDGLRARTVTVKIRDADFVTRQASRTLPEAIETDRAIAQVARALLGKLRRARRVGVRLLGVALSGFEGHEVASSEDQLALFDAGPATPRADTPVETERDRALSRAVDTLRARFGERAVVPGSLLGE